MSETIFDREFCEKELERAEADYEKYKAMGMQLNLARGKPCREQLDLSMKILDVVNSRSVLDSENGTDCRNYGMPDGLPEAKKLMGELMGVPASKVMVFGNSSLDLMFQTICHSMINGISGCEPMMKQPKIKWLCPAPGYDRHFAVTQKLGFELITIHMREDGPDMDEVRSYVEHDPAVKGIWCVPKYQNPLGMVFSDKVVHEFAELNPAAPDFRIYWDNAYCIHPLYPDEEQDLPDILSLCEAAGHPDMVCEFCSTSKIVFPGNGISAIATSTYNQNDLKNYFKYETIGPDKINQLRYVRFLKNKANVRRHMRQHAEIMRPKFEKTIQILKEELGDLKIADWTEPKGGYFISLNTRPGCAKEVIRLAKEAGVTFTSAGATYPYGIDPEDRNIRIAPSYAEADEIEKAVRILTVCIRVATFRSMLEQVQ